MPPKSKSKNKTSKRQRSINKSIVQAIKQGNVSRERSLLARFLAFWHLYRIKLICYREDLSQELRGNVWGIEEADYKRSFVGNGEERGQDTVDGEVMLKSIGDLGYSGSTFFTTPDSKFLIKSLPRRFEYAFFRDEMLHSYYYHMHEHPDSLLVRITDFLIPPFKTIGGIANLVPTHHIVMENIQYGKDEVKEYLAKKRNRDQHNGANGTSQPQNQNSGEDGNSQPDWETYDLKPTDYFYPRRDILPESMTSEETMQRLINTFDDKMRLTRAQFQDFYSTLEKDTLFLQKMNVVDYSLCLVRFPASASPPAPDQHASTSVSQTKPNKSHATGTVSPTDSGTAEVNDAPPSWRRGITSTDGKWTYRAILLDFLWSKHNLRAHATTGAIRTFNLVARQGDMSISTTPENYRSHFLEMVRAIVEIRGSIS